MAKNRSIAVVSSVVLSLCLLASQVGAEVTQKQGVRVTVQGDIAPKSLPRGRSAPVSVSLAGEIEAKDSGSLPQLERLQVAINSAGHLDLRGVPHCRIGHINPSTTQQALAACRSSLIGEGSFEANVILSEQSPFPSKGRLLAFNGTIGRKPAIFAHVYGTTPLPTSFVFAFRVEHRKGTYGTLLEASFPNATGDWGYITKISLKLNRGHILSAACPAPQGFSNVAFPLMRVGFAFKGGLNLTNTLTRSCKAQAS